MDVAFRGLLLQQCLGLLSTVVGAAEQRGEGHHIDVLLPTLIGVQIALGRGARGGGGILTLLHGPQQVRLVKGLIIHEHAPVHLDGHGDPHETGLFFHLGGQIAAAVHNDFETHIIHLQM